MTLKGKGATKLALVASFGLLVAGTTASQVAVAQGASAKSNEQLVFMLAVGLATPITGRNGMCFSNIVSLPAPKGWRDGKWPERGEARKIIEPYEAKLKALCSKIAPLADRGPAQIAWNDNGLETMPQKTYDDLRSKGHVEVKL